MSSLNPYQPPQPETGRLAATAPEKPVVRSWAWMLLGTLVLGGLLGAGSRMARDWIASDIYYDALVEMLIKVLVSIVFLFMVRKSWLQQAALRFASMTTALWLSAAVTWTLVHRDLSEPHLTGSATAWISCLFAGLTLLCLVAIERRRMQRTSKFAKPSCFLFWFSASVLFFLSILWMAVMGSTLVEIVDGGSSQLPIMIVALISSIICGGVGIPQALSVFGCSMFWTRIAIGVSVAGVIISLMVAVVYPIVEYNLDHSPPGSELLGLFFYGLLAGLFYLNRRLHIQWLNRQQSHVLSDAD